MLPGKESKLLGIPSRFNRSDLVCTPNKLSDSALSLKNLFKALDFLYTYPNLKYLSVKWWITHTFHAKTQKGPYMLVCTNSKHSLNLVFLVIFPSI